MMPACLLIGYLVILRVLLLIIKAIRQTSLGYHG